MYAETKGTIAADDGTEIGITIQHVNIHPELAKALFAEGEETGDWGWKHKVWYCDNVRHFEHVRRAARFYYGWNERSERISRHGESGIRYEACYAC